MLGFELLNLRRVIDCNVSGEPLVLRTRTPDLRVALETLSGEFDLPLAYVNNRCGLIVDAGGYIGTAAIVFARTLPEATVLCLEPSPENAEMCRRNTKGFQNVVVWEAALTPATGERAFYGSDTGEWGHSLFDRSCAKKYPMGFVQCVDMEKIIENFYCSDVELLKLDIEGAEKELFEKNKSWIDKTHIVFIELHDRIVEGCSQSICKAMYGRTAIMSHGEKIMFVRKQSTYVS